MDILQDPARLEALHRLNIVDSGTEAVFDDLVRLTANIFGVELATIHLIDDHRQWVKASSNGTCMADTPVGQTFCQMTVVKQDMVLIPDLTQDPVLHSSEFVTGPTQLRFYAGMPLITEEGYIVGTLCLLDGRPNVHESFSEHQISVYRQLADTVTRTMELRNQHLSAQQRFLKVVEEDGATGLINSRGLVTQIREALNAEDRDYTTVGMVELRLQGLERLRHAYGAEFGNQLVQRVVERIEPLLVNRELFARLSDSRLLIARVEGGSNESALYAAITRWAEARAREVVALFDTAFIHNAEPFHLLAHVGMAYSSRQAPSLYALLDRVDGVVFKAQNEHPGGSAMCWSNPALEAEYRRGVSIESRLRQAIEDETLSVVYQPIVDLNAGNRVVGAEALVRWPQPSGPPVSLGFFVPLAEELGLIGRLGLWVFAEACRSLRAWCDQTGERLWMSVNVSPRQLQDPSLTTQLERVTREAGLAPDQIRLEITESGLIEQFERIAERLNQLTDRGFKLALDDFGTGYSSLSRLTHLPFHVLKVDRSFVSDSPRGPGAAVVASLSSLADSLDLEKVGEGVETEAEEAFLREHGYHYAQGFRYAEPLEAGAFIAHLQADRTPAL